MPRERRIRRTVAAPVLVAATGQTAVKFRGPFIGATLGNKHRTQVVFLAQGIGITPHRSILRNIAHNKLPVHATLIHVDRGGHPFREETQTLAAEAYFPESADEFKRRVLEAVGKLPDAAYYVAGGLRSYASTLHPLRQLGIKSSAIHHDRLPNYMNKSVITPYHDLTDRRRKRAQRDLSGPDRAGTDATDPIRVGIAGAGMIGRALAVRFATAGHEVMLSNSRGPGTLAEVVGSIQGRVSAGTVAEAARFGQVVAVAIPVQAIRTLPPQRLGDATVVKAFNTIHFRRLLEDSRPDLPAGRRLAIPIAGDDARRDPAPAARLPALPRLRREPEPAGNRDRLALATAPQRITTTCIT